MRVYLSIGLAVLLTACAGVQSSNPRSVVVRSITAAGAQEQAQAECRKYNRYARLGGQAMNGAYFFDCVE